ncbi:MAG: hypothetical protein FWG65_02815 [Turicibacter sp.]|nr:hypothetical protein [Turicibacter sp.]
MKILEKTSVKKVLVVLGLAILLSLINEFAVRVGGGWGFGTMLFGGVLAVAFGGFFGFYIYKIYADERMKTFIRFAIGYFAFMLFFWNAEILFGFGEGVYGIAAIAFVLFVGYSIYRAYKATKRAAQMKAINVAGGAAGKVIGGTFGEEAGKTAENLVNEIGETALDVSEGNITKAVQTGKNLVDRYSDSEN